MPTRVGLAEPPLFIPARPQIGSISNGSLTHSLLDIYLGANPVSKPAKESFGQGLAAMVLS